MELTPQPKHRTSATGLILSSIAFFIVFVSASFIINAVIFAQAHEVVTFFRDDHQFIASPLGLAITGFTWSVLISLSYALFGTKLNVAQPYQRGLAYGAIVFFFFVWQQELFFYQFVDFEIEILIGAISHMAVAFPIGCALVAIFQAGFPATIKTGAEAPGST